MITGMPRIAIGLHDLDRAIATFRDGFGLPVDELAGTVATLGVRIAMCTPPGGSNIELMAPSDPAKPLTQSLQRFLDRRGEGLFALMLEAPDPNAEAEALVARGLQVMPLMPGAGGRDIHPRSTHGVLIRVYPTRPLAPPAAGANAAPAALTGIVRVVVAVRDHDHAVAVYRDRFALRVEELPEDRERGVRVAHCRPGSGGLIELVSPTDTARPFGAAVATFLERRGEGMFALVLRTGDLAATQAALTARGIRTWPLAGVAGAITVDPLCSHGAPVHIEQARG
jgi:catechol 2,3-dioxygenase-like lactoylglutathione lyase family enzyme